MIDWVSVLLAFLGIIPIQLILHAHNRSIEINKESEEYYAGNMENISKYRDRTRSQCWRRFVDFQKESIELATKKVSKKDPITGNEIILDYLQSKELTPDEEDALLKRFGPQYDKMAKEIDEINKPYSLNIKYKEDSIKYGNSIFWFMLIINILIIITIILLIILLSYNNLFLGLSIISIIELLIMLIVIFIISNREVDKKIRNIKKELNKMIFEAETGIPYEELPTIEID